MFAIWNDSSLYKNSLKFFFSFLAQGNNNNRDVISCVCGFSMLHGRGGRGQYALAPRPGVRPQMAESRWSGPHSSLSPKPTLCIILDSPLCVK